MMFRSLGGALVFLAAPLSAQTPEPDGRDRTFDLRIENQLDEPITFEIDLANLCYEGLPRAGETVGPIPPGGKAVMWIARVQLSECHGKNGYFRLTPKEERFHGEGTSFAFDNEGQIRTTSEANRYFARLSDKDQADGSFTWTILEPEQRLARPVDEQLTRPRNRVARDAGTWTGGKVEACAFQNQPEATGSMGLPLIGNFYDHVLGRELFHPQHVVRLANKNGRAYFMVSQSRAHNGWISLLETDDGVLDEETDLLRAQGHEKPVGRYVWQDFYARRHGNGGFGNPVGNWNHPGRMEVVGGVLVVAAQNWDDRIPTITYGPGDSEDKVLFYDVRDPEHPRYWGAMRASELGVTEVAALGLVRTPEGLYVLSMGGGGVYATWATTELSPNIEDWARVSTGAFGGQHGTMFTSTQELTSLSDSSPARGSERVLYFDASGEDNSILLAEFSFTTGGTRDPASQQVAHLINRHYPIDLIGADRHWDSNSLYVSTRGKPVLYSMEAEPGMNGVLFQVACPD